MTGLQGRSILVGVTGSIAAFKVAGWVHALVKEEARVTVVMTGSATRFVSELTFAALSGNRVHVDMFSPEPESAMAHISLAREADLVLVAPATAHTIARLAGGLADDLLVTSVLAAAGKPVVVCPAMNSAMYAHPATQANIARLRELGYRVVDPSCGRLACGDEGQGRLAEWDTAREQLLACCTRQDLAGRKVLVTAGPTREEIDPARYISNRSSGRMGFALARAARRRGAEVTLISGPTGLPRPPHMEVIRVTSAREMQEAVNGCRDADIVVMAAAVADFRPAWRGEHKVKKGAAPLTLDLARNDDILAGLGRGKRPGQLLVGFAAESRDLEKEGRRKLEEKNLDLVVANDISRSDAGFAAETNQVLLIDRSGSFPLPLLSKEETAERIWDHLSGLPAQA